MKNDILIRKFILDIDVENLNDVAEINKVNSALINVNFLTLLEKYIHQNIPNLDLSIDSLTIDLGELSIENYKNLSTLFLKIWKGKLEN